MTKNDLKERIKNDLKERIQGGMVNYCPSVKSTNIIPKSYGDG